MGTGHTYKQTERYYGKYEEEIERKTFIGIASGRLG